MAWREERRGWGPRLEAEQEYVGCPRCGLVIERHYASGDGTPLCPDCRRFDREQVVMRATETPPAHEASGGRPA
jgi:hypothetical protein